MKRAGLLLTASAAAYFLISIGLIFAGDELLAAAGAARTPAERLLVQLLGGALFGIAMLNWTNRFAPIGGIYGRPLVLANFAAAFVSAMALLRAVRGGSPVAAVVVLLVLYGALAIAFGAKLFSAGPGSRPS